MRNSAVVLKTYNMLTLTGLVVFPDMVIHFEVSGDRAVDAITMPGEGQPYFSYYEK